LDTMSIIFFPLVVHARGSIYIQIKRAKLILAPLGMQK
jgi:hypothetical protein